MVKVNGVNELQPKTAISMKVSINLIKNLVLVLSLGSLVIIIRVFIKMMNDMDTVKCIGLMVVAIKENGSTESRMGSA